MQLIIRYIVQSGAETCRILTTFHAKDAVVALPNIITLIIVIRSAWKLSAGGVTVKQIKNEESERRKENALSKKN